MQIKNNVRMFYSRVQTILRRRSSKEQKPMPEIVSGPPISPSVLFRQLIHSIQSAPFNFQREPVSLPGISEDE